MQNHHFTQIVFKKNREPDFSTRRMVTNGYIGSREAAENLFEKILLKNKKMKF